MSEQLPSESTCPAHRPKVSVVVPTKDEGRNIRDVLESVAEYADEVLVVDGHSKDETRAIAESLGARVVLDEGKGKGSGIRTGIRQAAHPLIVFIDADGSHDARDIPRLVDAILETDAAMVIGSRMKGGSDELHGTIPEFIRLMGNELLTVLINLRFKANLTDSQNGFRAIWTDVARQLDLRETSHAIETEMDMQVLKRGLTVAEVPSHEYRRRWGESKLLVTRIVLPLLRALLRNMF